MTEATESIRLLDWNIQWQKPGTQKGDLVNQVIAGQAPDIACITEGFENQFSDGHTICSEADYGYRMTPGRRKVLLWSQAPWTEIDSQGDERMPPGRFIAGTTESPIGPLRMLGVCIPWAAAHVSTGNRNRTRWEDHLAYLKGLKELLEHGEKIPKILVGDFNQTIPRTHAPQHVFESLVEALGGMAIATRGVVDKQGKKAIDHVCHCSRLNWNLDRVIPQNWNETILSDHFGVVGTIARG